MSCRACIPLDCLDTDDFGISDYSIDRIQAGPILVCPEGYSCNPSQLKMLCCDKLITSDVRIGASPEEIATLAIELYAKCAQISLDCPGPTNPTNPTDPVSIINIFSNRTEPCASMCPDGTSFTYIVGAGEFIGGSQGAADELAHRAACRLAAQHRICLSTLPDGICYQTAFSQTITATGGFLSDAFNTWEIISGSLPDGLTLNTNPGGDGTTVTLTGTPTVEGSFTFYVKITAPNGDYMVKKYTMCVARILPATLPDGTIGTAYSQTLTGGVCSVAPLSWQVVSGALPPGLVLDESTGVVSGTPTGMAASYFFTILLQDHAT